MDDGKIKKLQFTSDQVNLDRELFIKNSTIIEKEVLGI